MSRFFEIEDVQRVRRTGDHVRRARRGLSEPSLFEKCGHSAECRNVRARGEEPQELAPGAGKGVVLFHGADATPAAFRSVP